MNRDDLIERLKVVRDLIVRRGYFEFESDMNEAIAALSPVLPEDVEKILHGKLSGGDPYVPKQVRDLIERLQLENEKWRKYYKDTTAPVIQEHIDDIARLESMLDRLAEDKFMYTDEVGAVAHDWVLEYHKRIEYAASHRNKDDD